MNTIKEKHERNLRILSLSRSGLSARRIAEALGLSHRQVQRITAQTRAEDRQRLESLGRDEKPTGRGRTRALEALESLGRAQEAMLDIVYASDPNLSTALQTELANMTFDSRREEIAAALMLLPEIDSE
jgi:FixJ family two-component response regulator